MSVKFLQNEKHTSYFITFTCIDWKNIISESNCYFAFYNWFNYLKTLNVKVLAYVIMPNHFHAIFYLPDDCDKNINQIVSNGKRFLTYEIVALLVAQKNEKLLKTLNKNLRILEIKNGSKHKVFKPSFDCKEMFDESVLEAKIKYIHENPCKGKWCLAKEYTDYEFSSAAFYEDLKANEFLTHYKCI